jgi:hypothetical protein
MHKSCCLTVLRCDKTDASVLQTCTPNHVTHVRVRGVLITDYGNRQALRSHVQSKQTTAYSLVSRVYEVSIVIAA